MHRPLARYLFLLLSLSLIAFPQNTSPAEKATSTTPPDIARPWAHEKSDLKPDPRVVWGRLDNGLRYAILPHIIPAKRVSIVLLVQAGSIHEKDDERGYAHFVEHMAFRDTRDFPGDDGIHALQRLGLGFGAHTNAETDYFETHYRFDDLPTDTPDALATGLKILRSMADGILFLDAAVEHERGVVLSEMNTDTGDTHARLWPDRLEFIPPDNRSPSVGQLDSLFAKTRFPERTPFCTEDSINAATTAKLRAYYERNYRADRMILAVVGAITPAKAEELIQQTFASLRAQPAQPVDTSVEIRPNPTNASKIVINDLPSASDIRLSFCSTHDQTAPDNEAWRRQLLCQRIALGMLAQRLQAVISQPSPTIRTATAELSHYVPGQEIALIEATCKPDKWNTTLAELDTQIRRVCESGFSYNELKLCAAQERLHSAQKAIELINTPSGTLARSLAFSISRDVVFDTSKAELDLIKTRLDSLTASECTAAIKQLFAIDQRTLWISGHFPSTTPTPIDLEKILTKSRSRTLRTDGKPAEHKSKPFPFTNFGPPGTIVKREHNAVLDAELIQFANGVRLNLKPTAFEFGRLHFVVNFGGGELSSPPNKPGLALRSFIAWMFSGHEGLSLDDGAAITNPTAIRNLTWATDGFRITTRTSKASLLLHLQDTAAHFSHPALNKAGWSAALETIHPLIAESSLTDASDNALRRHLVGDHHALFPSLEAITARTLSEGKKYFLPELTATPIEITIVGDFNSAEAIQAVASTFGALPSRKAADSYAAQRRITFPPKQFAETNYFNGPTSMASVSFAWPSPELTSMADRLQGEVLAAILEDRLRLKLRNEMGATYSPSASFTFRNDLTPNPSYFLCTVETDPEKTDLIATAIRQISGQLARKGATAEEFERSLQPIIRENESNLRNNVWWMTTLTDCQADLRLAEAWSQKAAILHAITLPEITAMAAKSFTEERRSNLVTLPVLKAEDLASKAIDKITKKDYPAAIAYYDQAIKLDSNQFEYFSFRGDAKANMNDNPGALADYTAAIKLKPDSDQTYSERAGIYAEMKRFTEAIADCSNAIKLNPNDALYFSLRAFYEDEQGNPTAALSDYTHAIALNPKDAQAYRWRSKIYAAQGDCNNAFSDLNTAIKLEPTDSSYYKTRGDLYYTTGDFERAIEDYNQTISLASDHSAYSRFFRMLLLARLHRGEPAIELGTLIRTWKKESWVKSIGLFLSGDISEIDFFTAAEKGETKKISGQKCEAFYYVGMVHLLKNENDLARNFFEKCILTHMTRYSEYAFAQAELAWLKRGN